MSKRPFEPLKLPNRWLYCPRKSETLIADKFVAFKVPLATKFNPNVPPECRFNMQMLLDSVKKNFHKKIGLIIDLTNTNRFYDAEKEVKDQGIRYVKIQCKGHGETPTRENRDLFLSIVESFMTKNPLDLIGVHCTHGFNRTGFLICSYLVEKLDFSVDMAVSLFALARPPGIYKQDYLNELFAHYDPEAQVPHAPALPNWETEEEKPAVVEKESTLSDDDDFDFDYEPVSNTTKKPKFSHPKRPRKEETKLNPVFADPDLAVILMKYLVFAWKHKTYAIGMALDSQALNHTESVGKRMEPGIYLMYINGRGRIYMLDRDNSVFCVHNLSFPDRSDLDRHLTSTLVDGEFVVDKDPKNGAKIPRFLIYDVVKFEDDQVNQSNFDVRMQCIDREIIGPRHEALRVGKINRAMEPFSVRKKEFFPIMHTVKLLSPEFEKQLTHGIDGLIYQPVDDPYKCGRCDSILKWKPPSMNSVDFRLDIVEHQEIGGLPEKKGLLFVNGYDKPFSVIRVTKAIKDLNGKIIECRWYNNQWDFMRERVDKSYPNHYNTALAVCESIKFPVTQELLIDKIRQAERNKMAQSQGYQNYSNAY
ncbi:mRNA-capping enzyme isoform X1 [Brachionus plicatilis]|uniref:mRNA-capping enzyme n=1 Tax=Brachionus plicatilis TaxID=10195 RepID=A0A3M7RHE6_BRAPC|nr:mRNA-capping enzyme isoform X1 [Brachionus plicatilis]